jgi:uncharacterized protein
LKVEVAYALPDRQRVIALEVEPGTTLRAAIGRAGILREFPEIDLARNRVGVFGQVREPDEPAQAGDRIEIYRPLAADPKELRRKRATSSA